jgi:hypothetical protein
MLWFLAGEGNPNLGELALLKRHERERPTMKRHVQWCLVCFRELFWFACLNLHRQLQVNA